MVVDEPQKLYHSLSVTESVQSELFLMYLCLVSRIIFSSSASLMIHLCETSMIGVYPKASLRICLFQQRQTFDQHVLYLTVRLEL